MKLRLIFKMIICAILAYSVLWGFVAWTIFLNAHSSSFFWHVVGLHLFIIPSAIIAFLIFRIIKYYELYEKIKK